jgi:hypothetical protein
MKLANRHQVNPRLTREEAADPDRFRRDLEACLGPPDDSSDAEFSYCVRDRQTGLSFLAYSAQSGPAYGGEGPDCCVDFEGHDYRIRPEVLRSLAEFEEWLLAASRPSSA